MVERILADIRSLATECIRIRDQDRGRIDGMNTAATEMKQRIQALLAVVSGNQALPPESLAGFAEVQVSLHPNADNAHQVLPGVTLGELRAWVAARKPAP